MINIVIYKDSDSNYIGFNVSGHSGYAEAGSDIVCASVSTLVINTINSIENFTNDDIEYTVNEEDAVINFIIKGKKSEESLLLLKSLVLGITFLHEAYSEFIKIAFKEV